MMRYTVGSGLSVSDVPNLFLPEVRGSRAVERAQPKEPPKPGQERGQKGEREDPGNKE